VEVNAPPIEDAVMNAVKAAGQPATFAEICEALKTVAEWKDKTVEDAVRKLAETGRLASEEIPNPVRLPQFIPGLFPSLSKTI
jgi:predicted transcriptional regulator